MPRPTIAIVGASRDRRKFGNRAVRAYKAAGFEVFPINPHATEIEGLKAFPSLDAAPTDRFDRVSLYVPAQAGLKVLESIKAEQVGELWLNPGADAPAVVERARALGLNVVQACSLLALEADPEAP
ncbi:MAG TPA: CoA-binding protein [Isosphaeraceae bacterium]|jgi:hypothetical protein|nr:CoA-binding protein [Isosphaeraceae bacterium]